MIKIYTDGSCLRNPGGAGGWAFAVVHKGKITEEHSGSIPESTSNRAELIAIINAIKHLKTKYSKQKHRTIISDSRYCVKGIKSWMYMWAENDFGNGRKNPDLWREIYALTKEFPFNIEWVKGHNENEYNERCDVLAGEAALRKL